MSATSNRDSVISLAKTDPVRAAERAKSIGDPWFRCQALSWVAWLTPAEKSFLQMIGEAEKAALKADDPYKSAGALAWPLAALIGRKYRSQAGALLKTAMGSAAKIENPVSRTDALILLWQAAFPLGMLANQDLFTMTFNSASQAGDNWKCQGHLSYLALTVASEDPELARQTVEAMQACQKKRQAERWLAAGQFGPPQRQFFH